MQFPCVIFLASVAFGREGNAATLECLLLSRLSEMGVERKAVIRFFVHVGMSL